MSSNSKSRLLLALFLFVSIPAILSQRTDLGQRVESARDFDDQGDRATALLTLDTLLKMPEAVRDSFYGEALWLYGRLQQKNGHYFGSIDTYRHLKDWSTERPDSSLISDAFMEIGYAYFSLGKLDSAYQYASNSLEIEELRANRKKIRDRLLMLSVIRFQQNGFTNALTLGIQALEMAEADSDSLDIASAYRQIGLAYKKQDQYPIADSIYKKCVAIIRTQNDPWELMGILNDHAMVIKYLPDYERALEKLNESLRLADSLRYPAGKVIVQTNRGVIYYLMGNLVRADSILQYASSMAREYGFSGPEAETNIFLGKIHFDRGQLDQALSLTEKGIALAKGDGDIDKSLDGYQTLFQILKRRGNYQAALGEYETMVALRDSMNKAATAGQIALLEQSYQAEKKERLLAQQTDQIELLEQKNKLARQQRRLIFGGSLFLLLLLGGGFLLWNRERILQQERLKQESQQWQTLNEQKSRFLTNIAHELRTPLTLVSGPMDHYLNQYGSQLPKKQYEWLSKISRNSHRLNDMVKEILDLARLEDQQIKAEPTPTELPVLLKRTFQHFESAAQVKGHVFELEIDRSLPQWVQLDVPKMEKVLNNLLSNAIKFTPYSGQVRIQATHSNGRLDISVSDTGRGIPPDEIPLVFDRYFQTRRHDLPLEGGSGIGLALTKELVELMNGTISVKSTIGKGTVFQVLIPIEETVPSEGKQPTVDQTSNGNGNGHHTKESALAGNGIRELSGRILLVEDNVDMQLYISELLTPRYEVTLASDGARALEIIREEGVRPDLIISDLMMPGMDGFTLLHHLKQDEMLAAIPTVMLTARSDQQDRLQALTMGVDDYLTKPFSSVELQIRIHNLLEFSQKRQAIPMVAGPASKEASSVVLKPADRAWLKEVEELLRQEISNARYANTDLANAMNLSERQLSRRIKQLTGLSPKRYFREIRLQNARQLLERGMVATVSEASYEVGFETPDYFSKLFTDRFGRRPSDFL